MLADLADELELRFEEVDVLLGVIEEVLERPANDVWVARHGSIEQLIPATRDAVLSVDLSAGRVVVADWIFKVEDAKDKD